VASGKSKGEAKFLYSSCEVQGRGSFRAAPPSRVTDEAVGAIGQYFGGASMAAISKTVARRENRRLADRGWDRRLARLSQ